MTTLHNASPFPPGTGDARFVDPAIMVNGDQGGPLRLPRRTRNSVQGRSAPWSSPTASSLLQQRDHDLHCGAEVLIPCLGDYFFVRGTKVKGSVPLISYFVLWVHILRQPTTSCVGRRQDPQGNTNGRRQSTHTPIGSPTEGTTC